jgi:rsbT co-antagonist protein RsbR
MDEAVFSDVLHVPLTGVLTRERMNLLQTKVLEACSERNASYVMFDFTGITELTDDVWAIFAVHLEDTRKMLQLLGTRSIYAGFSPLMVQNLVRSGIDPQVKTFGLFHQAMQYITAQKGYEVRKKSSPISE